MQTAGAGKLGQRPEPAARRERDHAGAGEVADVDVLAVGRADHDVGIQRRPRRAARDRPGREAPEELGCSAQRAALAVAVEGGDRGAGEGGSRRRCAVGVIGYRVWADQADREAAVVAFGFATRAATQTPCPSDGERAVTGLRRRRDRVAARGGDVDGRPSGLIAMAREPDPGTAPFRPSLAAVFSGLEGGGGSRSGRGSCSSARALVRRRQRLVFLAAAAKAGKASSAAPPGGRLPRRVERRVGHRPVGLRAPFPAVRTGGHLLPCTGRNSGFPPVTWRP